MIANVLKKLLSHTTHAAEATATTKVTVIAITGVCERSLTSASLDGARLSNDHVKNPR